AIALLDPRHLDDAVGDGARVLVHVGGVLVPPRGRAVPLVALLGAKLARVDRLRFHTSPLIRGRACSTLFRRRSRLCAIAHPPPAPAFHRTFTPFGGYASIVPGREVAE